MLQNYLKVKRWERGIKQYQLASRVNVPPPIISLIENGHLDPDDRLKFKIAKALKCKSGKEIFPTPSSKDISRTR